MRRVRPDHRTSAMNQDGQDRQDGQDGVVAPWDIYHALRRHLGPKDHWWPVDTRLEILIGSILVQNTNWRNAERSLECIRNAGVSDISEFTRMPSDTLMELIRSSGFQKAKAATIIAVARWEVARWEAGHWEVGHAGVDDPAGVQTGPALVEDLTTSQLREELRNLRGIGPETADVIMLYVFDRPTFIADTYARRLFTKLGCRVPKTYDAFRKTVMNETSMSVGEWQEFHGLIDDYAKTYCRTDDLWRRGPLSSPHFGSA